MTTKPAIPPEASRERRRTARAAMRAASDAPTADRTTREEDKAAGITMAWSRGRPLRRRGAATPCPGCRADGEPRRPALPLRRRGAAVCPAPCTVGGRGDEKGERPPSLAAACWAERREEREGGKRRDRGKEMNGEQKTPSLKFCCKICSNSMLKYINIFSQIVTNNINLSH
jgi:hypothetical protein